MDAIDPKAGMSAEEREAFERQQFLQHIATRDGQASEYRDALQQALNATNLEISANGVQPRIDGVIAALTMLQAEFIAMYPDRNERRLRLADVEKNLSRLVTLRVTTGSKPARELDDADLPLSQLPPGRVN